MRTASISFNYVLSHKMRFEGKHYLNDNALSCMSIEKSVSKCFCLDDIADVFNPPVFKRQFCKQSGNSVMYFQSSDVSTASETSSVFINKRQVESLNLLVRKNDILITGFGTIGNVRLVSRLQDGVCYANNVCRVRIKDGVYLGYIYAFLSSKYAYAQLNNNASGSVVRYIEAPGVKKTLVPSFPESFQKEVDDLIQESARLREEAAEALEEAKAILTTFIGDAFNQVDKEYFGKVSINSIRKTLNHRFDPPVYVNKGVSAAQYLSCKTIPLGECNARFWYPGIFKRAYVNEGLPYIKGSSLFEVNPFKRCDYLSRSRTPGLEDLWLKEGQILMSCAGICGQVKLITKEYEDKKAIGSPDIIRIHPMDVLYTKEYLFVYLQLPFVYDYMQSLKYGSVIERFDIDTIKTIPVVTPTRELSDEVTGIIKRYMDCTYRAFNSEEKAIRMVEEEIEKWNK